MYGIVYFDPETRTQWLYENGYKTRKEAEGEKDAFFSPSEAATVIRVSKSVLRGAAWPGEPVQWNSSAQIL